MRASSWNKMEGPQFRPSDMLLSDVPEDAIPLTEP
jgi:hypothetical protein